MAANIAVESPLLDYSDTSYSVFHEKALAS
jgi:hypothetical protein